ncbi:DUF748 domain-containing protein [Nibrella saemangeumensis]|uniref:DUF748 domain-containing protein n=1 Tax=Nibrella saemangeumensis TaxID=1084526 RepID=A0ABP8MHE3_9BACT
MKRSVKIIIGVVVLIIIARLLLPFIVLRYVNKVLADMGDYTGHIDDVDIWLIRGAYQIDNLNIRKVNGKVKEPFLYIPKTDLSVEWQSLFKGRLVGEIEAYDPELNFSFSENEEASQTGKEVDWTEVVRELLPIEINRFAAYNGDIELVNLFSATNTGLTLKNMDMEIRNIRNVEDKNAKLPSPVTASADVPGWGGTMNFNADMNLLKQVPDFNYNLKLDNLQLVKLNKVVRSYANLDFEAGTVSVVSEMAMTDGKMQGYFKPLTKNMKIFKWKEGEKRTVGRFFTELLAEGASEILENQKKDQIATRVPISGTVESAGTETWPILIGVLQNAYVEAFRAEFDHTLSVKETIEKYREARKEKREERKAERKERREERKEARQQKREERKKEREKRRKEGKGLGLFK